MVQNSSFKEFEGSHCFLADTILSVADSPDKFPFKVRQGILEAALGCEVFDAQRAMLQKRLFAVWDKECWECNVQTDDLTWKTIHRGIA